MTAKTFTTRHGAVTVTREDVADNGGTLRPSFVITTPTGYRATLTECLRDDCAEGRVTPCATPTGDRGQHSVGGKTSVNAWLAHSAKHCHATHEVSAYAFAERVLKTFAPAPKKLAAQAVGVARGSRYVERALMPLPIAA